MKTVLIRQMVFIPILYVMAKYFWDSFLVGILPDVLKNVMSDLLGPFFIMVFVLWSFIFIFWKIPILGKLSQFLFGTKPYIQGTWLGQLKYKWNDKEIEKTVFLVVKQSDGFSIHIWLLTDERKSSGIFEEIIQYKGLQRIIYTYKNEESPNNKVINPSHEGFCQLDIVNSSSILKGIYYTDRKTFGCLCFEKRYKKIIMDFDEARKQFGVFGI